MKEYRFYFIHTPKESWHPEDLEEIQDKLGVMGFSPSNKAAIGEGGGGPGWETVIELVLNVSAIVGLTEQIWKVVKYLKSKKPKEKAPNGREIYRVVFHTNHGQIGIDLTSSVKDLDIAINKNLKMYIENENLHVYNQSKTDWFGY